LTDDFQYELKQPKTKSQKDKEIRNSQGFGT